MGVILDMKKVNRDFKTSEFVTENGIPKKVEVINGLGVFYTSSDKIYHININLLLEKDAYSNSSGKSFTFSLTNLIDSLSTGHAASVTEKTLETYDRKGPSKVDKLNSLLNKELAKAFNEDSELRPEKPITIRVKDSKGILHRYYITRVQVGETYTSSRLD